MLHVSPPAIQSVSYGTRSACRRTSRLRASVDGGSGSTPSRAKYAARTPGSSGRIDSNTPPLCRDRQIHDLFSNHMNEISVK